jgi:hypothetical protein
MQPGVRFLKTIIAAALLALALLSLPAHQALAQATILCGPNPCTSSPMGDPISNQFGIVNSNFSMLPWLALTSSPTGTILGNATGSTAAPGAITLGTNLSFAGSVLNATGGGSGITALTGPVTASGTGSVASSITALAVTPAMLSYATMVSPLQFGAICNGSSSNATVDTAGIQAAINYIGSSGTVQMPTGATCYVNSTITVAGNGVRIVGAGRYSSEITFVPSANGSVFKFYNGGSGESFGNSLIGVGFRTADTTYTKTAIEIIDQGGFELKDILVTGGTSWTGGSAIASDCGTTDTQAGSIALRICGRDNDHAEDLYFIADRNIVFSVDPNVATESNDHWHFQDVYITQVAGVANALIWVDPLAVMTNITFDGVEAWVGGTYGFYMNKTAAVYGDHQLSFDNVRGEQGSVSTDYLFYLSSNVRIDQPIFRNILVGTAANGWYLHGAFSTVIDGANFYGGGTSFMVADSSDFGIKWSGVQLGSGTAMTMTTQTLMSATYGYPNTSVPTDAIWNRTGEVSGSTLGMPLTLTTQGAFFTAPSSWGTAGYGVSIPALSVTDGTASGTIAEETSIGIGAPTIAATNAATTITNLDNVYIAAPIAGTNVTATNLWSLRTAGGILDGNTLSVYDSNNISAGHINFTANASTIQIGNSAENQTVTFGTTGTTNFEGPVIIQSSQNFTTTRILAAAAASGDIGSTALPFANLWLGTAATNNFKLQPAATAAARIINLWDFGANGPSTQNYPGITILTSQYTNSTTTFSNVAGGNTLQFPVLASTTYTAECHLYYQSVALGGLNIEFTGPASPTAVTYGLSEPTALGTTDNSVATAYSTSLGNVIVTAATNFDALVSFSLINGANAGTVNLLAKASTAVQLQIQAGSFCRVQ